MLSHDMISVIACFLVSATVLAEGNRDECSADLGWMDRDLVNIRQILFNLLSNACKFTENGNIRVEAGFDNCDIKPIELPKLLKKIDGLLNDRIPI